MFVSELVVTRLISKKHSWQLDEDLIWKDGDILIVIPKGFQFDFASVPWLFQRVFPKSGGKYDRASCAHDFLYVTEYFDRKSCDELFLKAMLSDGVPKWKAYSMYWAVRLGGWYVWNKHDPKEVQAIRARFNV